MNTESTKISSKFAWPIIIGVLLGAGVYYTFVRPAPVQNIPVTGGSTATSTASSTNLIGTDGQFDTTDWLAYTNYELGFSLQYPADVTVDSSDPAVFKVSFPKNEYFSTAYADDVSVSVSASAKCAAIDQGSVVYQPQSVRIGGVAFARNETSDVGAGNVHDTTYYDVIKNGVCYRILIVDHHANGAGLYESDAAKIAAMTKARDAEYARVNQMVQQMIYSFNFVDTPAGQDEGTVSGATPASTIFLSTISPTTVPVLGKLTVIGRGFSGHDTIVWISNGSVQGVLWGGMPTSDTSITMTVPDRVCTKYTGASGLPCPSFLILTPGVYTVDVANQNGTTDTVYVNISK